MTLLRVGILAAATLAAGAARADSCAMDAWNNGTVVGAFLFPNWYRAPVASFDVWECDGCTPANENVRAITVVNFGSAVAADIANVYWVASCGATTTGTLTLTYAGVYAEDGGSYPAWTWSGSTIDLGACPDLCGTPPCGGVFTIDIYATIASCPGQNVTVSMGLPVNSLNNPANPGSIWDNYPCAVPWFNSAGPMHTIYWAYKDGPDVIAPGDTATYTIYYG